MKKHVLAFDFGASSGRAMVGHYDAGKLVVEKVHRFPNYPKEVAGEYAWDVACLFEQIIEGMTQAIKRYPISSIGIDTDDERFVAPGQMVARIQKFASQTNQVLPKTDGEIIRCVYESLAMKYKYTFLEIIDALQEEFDTINILGGGAQATILCQMVADATNLRVCAGPVEATAIGNIAVQLQAQGIFKDVTEIREWVKTIADVDYYYPTEENAQWERQFSNYQKILKINQETKE